jgi:ribosomal subunit interface protein
MRVQIRKGRVKVTAALRAHVERRLGLALGRFGERIGPVVVRFSPLGDDSRCEIDLGLRPRKIRIEDSHADPFAALNHAADRISRSVARVLDRERELDDRVATVPRAAGNNRP